jgi:hypothetical protein
MNKRQPLGFDQVSVLQLALVHNLLVEVRAQGPQTFMLLQKRHRVVTTPEGSIKHLQAWLRVFNFHDEFSHQLTNFSVHYGVMRDAFYLEESLHICFN